MSSMLDEHWNQEYSVWSKWVQNSFADIIYDIKNTELSLDEDKCSNVGNTSIISGILHGKFDPESRS